MGEYSFQGRKKAVETFTMRQGLGILVAVGGILGVLLVADIHSEPLSLPRSPFLNSVRFADEPSRIVASACNVHPQPDLQT